MGRCYSFPFSSFWELNDIVMENKLVKCGCDGFMGNHSAANFQDSVYGHGMRTCNPAVSPSPGVKVFRCTVCGKEHKSGEEKSK